ncbi:MAG TPA: VOC family protein [Ignavibacteria bacterium]|nr:VOC family protein [Ignavibacteria bacterium]HMR40678.1 VOC family protein [Ignavibacteria bacterium]
MFIKEVKLNTGRLYELKEFYGSVLGLTLSSLDESSVSVKTKNSVLTFLSDQNTKGTDGPFYHIAFNIPDNQFKQAKKWLSERADLIKYRGEDEFPFESWNARAMYFYDPAGNILEFIARYDLRNSSEDKFSGKDILNVSEIGLPVRNAEIFIDKITAGFSLPLFSGDRKSFGAIGDDNGLMIVVPDKRIWYPNLKEAGIFPVTVIIRSGMEKVMRFPDLPYKIISES